MRRERSMNPRRHKRGHLLESHRGNHRVVLIRYLLIAETTRGTLSKPMLLTSMRKGLVQKRVVSELILGTHRRKVFHTLSIPPSPANLMLKPGCPQHPRSLT